MGSKSSTICGFLISKQISGSGSPNQKRESKRQKKPSKSGPHSQKPAFPTRHASTTNSKIAFTYTVVLVSMLVNLTLATYGSLISKNERFERLQLANHLLNRQPCMGTLSTTTRMLCMFSGAQTGLSIISTCSGSTSLAASGNG